MLCRESDLSKEGSETLQTIHSDTMIVPLLSSPSLSGIAVISSLFSVQSQRSRERQVRSSIRKLTGLTTIFITATARTSSKPEKQKGKDPAHARGWGAQGTCHSSSALLSRFPFFSFSVAKLLS